MADASETSSPPVFSTSPADVAQDEVYRPLSLLALFGFSLAVLYSFLVLLGGLVPIATRYPRLFILLLIAAPLLGAQVALLGRRRNFGSIASHAGLGVVVLAVILGLGGLVAYSSSSPWLALEGVGWLLLMAAVLSCWMARSRIASAEGTLAGASLANWGLALSLFFGLNYGAYLASNSFATHGQARAVADEFIRLIQDTDDPDSLLKAFVLTLPAAQRPASDLRRSVEIEHNVTVDGTGRTGGSFSTFCNSGFVHLLRAGPSRVSFARSEGSTFERGGYEVNLVYSIDNLLGTAELKVATFGQESPGNPGTGRQWQIQPNQTNIISGARNSAEGRGYEESMTIAREQVTEWINKVRMGDISGAYLDTVPEPVRRRQFGAAVLTSPTMIGAAGLPLVGALGITPEILRDFSEGRARFRTGALVEADPRVFFAPTEASRKVMIDEVRKLFQGGGPPNNDFMAREFAPMIGFKPNGDNSEYHFPARLITKSSDPSKTGYLIEMDVVVLGPHGLDKHSENGFRIGRVILLRGQTAPDLRRPPPG